MKPRVFSLIFISIVCVLGLMFPVIGQVGQEQAEVDVAPSEADNVEPARRQATVIDLQTPWQRELKIKVFYQRLRENNLPLSNAFFHHPIFAFIEKQSDSPEGLPPTVWAKVPLDNGDVNYLFELLLSDDVIEEVCIEAILAEESLPVPLDSEMPVTCIFWPTTDLQLVVKNVATGFKFGEVSEAISSDVAQTGIRLRVKSSDVGAFEQALKDDLVEFEWKVAYENLISAGAAQVDIIQGALDAVLDLRLTNEQKTEAAIVRQDQLNDLKQSIREQIRRDVSATSSTALNALLTAASGQVDSIFTFETISVNDLTPKELDALFNEYIEPRVADITQESEDKVTTVTMDKNTKKVTLGGSTGNGKSTIDIANKIKGSFESDLRLNADVEFYDEDSTQITDVDRDFEKITEAIIRPNSIAVSRLNKNYQSLTRQIATRLYIATGVSSQFEQITETRPSLTDAFVVAQFRAGLPDTDHVRVPLGTALCSFAAGDPPAGFEWLDGNSSLNWPQEPWVPSYLQGEPLPNMSGLLMGGTMNPNHVGTIFQDGQIRLENPPSASTINVTGFQSGGVVRPPYSVTFESDRPRFPNTGTSSVIPAPEGFTPGGIMLTLPDKTFRRSYSSASGAIVQTGTPQYQSHTHNSGDVIATLNNSSSLPIHMRCRWMIRVR